MVLSGIEDSDKKTHDIMFTLFLPKRNWQPYFDFFFKWCNNNITDTSTLFGRSVGNANIIDLKLRMVPQAIRFELILFLFLLL
jgi:hypothetical protein